MPIKAILFDLDGTLVNTLRVFPQLIVEQYSNNPNKKFIKYYLRRIGSFYNLKENDTWIKHSWFNLQLFRTIRADFNLSWICFLSGMIRILWKFVKWDENIHVFPEVPRTLLKLKEKNFLLGIVSNGSQRLIKKRFNSYLHLFDILVDSRSLKYKKPSPIPLLYALKKLNTSPQDAVFVGDTLVDIFAAQKAKIKIILTKTGVFGDPPLDQVSQLPVTIIPVVGKELLKLLNVSL